VMRSRTAGLEKWNLVNSESPLGRRISPVGMDLSSLRHSTQSESPQNILDCFSELVEAFLKARQ